MADNQNSSLGARVNALAEGQKVFDQRYTLMKIVGKSPTSVVWLAWDQKGDRDVALKFLPEMIKDDASAVATLKREIRKLQEEAKHAQIIQVLDLEQDGSMVAIVSEFVEGSSLTDLREARPNKVFAPVDLMDWMQQLCTVMAYAHNEAGICHGDLTTANLLINKKGVLRVTGLGMAKHISDFLSRTANPGIGGLNLSYHSPQRAAGGPPTPVDDIYSIGAIIYELLTSKPPFYTGDILLQVQHKQPPPMVHRRKELRVIGEPISRLWEETVALCLAKDPAQRPQSVQDLVGRLELEAAPTVEVQDAAPPPPPPPGSNKALVIAAAAIIVLLGIVGLMLGRGAKNPPAGQQVVKVVAKEETPEEKKKREEEQKRLKEAEANAKKLKDQIANLKAEEAKRAEELKKKEAEAKKLADEEAKKRAAIEAELKRQKDEFAKQKEQEEKLRKTATSAASQADRKAAEDALKKVQEAQENAKKLEAQLANLKMQEEKRKADEAQAATEAAKKKKEQDAKVAAMMAEQQAQEFKRRQMELEQKQKQMLLAAKRDEEEKAKKEAERLAAEQKAKKAEMERRKLVMGKPWENSIGIRFVPLGKALIASFECRVADFDAFVRESRFNAGAGWRSPGFRQDESHPVVNVSWSDAKAFCKWLTEKEVKDGVLTSEYSYRLPTDTEWSLAVGLDGESGNSPADRDGRIKGMFPWGSQWPPPPGSGNYTDRVSYDSFENTAPVGSFRANKNGFYDLGGNVWEWCEDWSDASQKNRVLRGGSWFGFIPGTLDSASRRYLLPEDRKNDCGFRIVIDKK